MNHFVDALVPEPRFDLLRLRAADPSQLDRVEVDEPARELAAARVGHADPRRRTRPVRSGEATPCGTTSTPSLGSGVSATVNLGLGAAGLDGAAAAGAVAATATVGLPGSGFAGGHGESARSPPSIQSTVVITAQPARNVRYYGKIHLRGDLRPCH